MTNVDGFHVFLSLSIVLHIHVVSVNQYLFIRSTYMSYYLSKTANIRSTYMSYYLSKTADIRSTYLCYYLFKTLAHNIIDNKTTLGHLSTSYTGQVTVVIHQMCPPVFDISISRESDASALHQQ